MNLVGISILFVGVIITNLLIQYVFIRLGKFDAINERSSHQTSATKTGGITLFTALLLTAFYFYFNNNEVFDFSLILPLAIIFVIGVYDDFYDADFKLKFFIQIIVAKLFIDQGFVINNYHGLFGLYEIPYFLAQLTTIFVFLVIVNAYNFIDGIDGLNILISSFSIFFTGFFLEFTPLYFLNHIILIALLPLLIFNFKKEKKVFLGDAGSLLLGSVVAINCFWLLNDQSILIPEIKLNRALLSIVLLFYPLADLLRVFILRIREKKSPFRPDKNHLHHYLLNKGLNHFQASITILMGSISLMGMVYLLQNFQTSFLLLFILLIFVLLFYLTFPKNEKK